VNLLRTSNGESLWADSFDVRSTDIFTIQDEVAQQVAARLRLRLNPTQQMRLAKRHTSNTVAYEYYVKGMYSLDQRGWSIEGKPQMEATIAFFKQAISADSQYALAHAQLAYAYAWMAVFIELDPVWVEYARQEIRQAEALDSQLAETHVARHLILWSAYEGYQTEAAIRALLLAQQLNPGIGHLELGVIYWHNGLEEQAGRELQRALEIDPTSEKVKEEIYNSTILSGRIDEALAAQQRFFNRGPGLKYYLEKNRLNDARPLLEQALAKDPHNPEVRLRKALFLALKEDFQAAEAELPWILEHIQKNRGYHHNAYEIARVYALAGKSREAMKWLRETAGTGLPCYPIFERDPYLNRIRQAPEFIQFMSEMKAQVEKYRREFG
jgi:tetratricopeptide (TPR) repeat protein